MNRRNPLAIEVAKLKMRLADMERRQENSFRHGPVAEVDAGKQMVRLKVGKGSDGKDQLSPWISYAQIAGALKVHTPPSVGQNMTLIAPGGDMEQGVALPFTWNNANESPSAAADENVLTFGSVKIELRGGELVITLPKLLVEAEGSTFELTGAGLKLMANFDAEGDSFTHNTKNVGDDHKHKDVQPGGGTTGDPV